jgi:hypothetical protein
VTRADIIALVAKAGIPRMPDFGGMIYAVPTRAWLSGPFYDYLKKVLWNFGTDTWAVKWECRDFSRAYATFAQVCNALTAGTPDKADALAVGEVWFLPDASRGMAPGSGHAINAAITEGGLIFLDPQNDQEWAMTPDEKASIYFFRW